MSLGPGLLNQWLVLTLGNGAYALPVQEVVEVLRMVAVRPLPEASAWTAGILNLRGRGVVVMDLRARLGLPSRAPDLGTQIVIVTLAGDLLGLIADDVTEIVTLPQTALKPADSRSGAGRMVCAVAHVGERLILVLDIGRLADLAADPGVAHAGT